MLVAKALVWKNQLLSPQSRRTLMWQHGMFTLNSSRNISDGSVFPLTHTIYPIAKLTCHELPHARRPAPLVRFFDQVSRNSIYPHSSRLATQGQSKAQLFLPSSPNGNMEFFVMPFRNHGTNTGSACRLNLQRTADCSGFLKGT